MQTLKAVARDGCGPGLVRLSGEFTTNSSNAVVTTRPSKSNVTITRSAAGVYLIAYIEPCLTVVSSSVSLGPATAVVGTGSVAFATAPPGLCWISKDFMTSDGSGHYKSDATLTTLLCLVTNFNSGAGGTLTDVYGLGNTSSVANYRLSYDIVLSTSTMNQ
jgi:hypothetical protein